MKAIILAAGKGSRMCKLTQNIPKPLLNINGKSIIERQLSSLKQNGILDIIIVIGPHYEKFNFKNVVCVNNLDYKKHDTLGSFMTARDYMNDEIITTYADQIFEEKILKSMTEFTGDIGIAVDLDWEKNYVNRAQHSKSEADNVLINGNEVLEIRKNILECKKNEKIGEFLGLMKLSRKGSKVFLDKYSELKISHQGKFHNAPSLEKAYLTDMLQELIVSGIRISPIYVNGKWCEIDTLQDLQIARKLFS